mgnify:FL=1|tara:strand:+ start:786 stop:1301 length:516 start_codon:yes stop_codon:yes gene_type:complete
MLSKNKLQKEITDNYNRIQQEGGSRSESAQGLAEAIVKYAEDAELPAAPTAKVKTARVGQGALQSVINGSFLSGDPTMTPLTAGIVAYVASSFTLFSNIAGTTTGVGACVMVVPPILAPVTALGMGGASQADVCELMATIIHTSFKSIVFNGATIVAPATVTVPVAGVPLL